MEGGGRWVHFLIIFLHRFCFTKIKCSPFSGTLIEMALPPEPFSGSTSALNPFFFISFKKVSGLFIEPILGIFLCRVFISAQSPCLDIKNHVSGSSACDAEANSNANIMTEALVKFSIQIIEGRLCLPSL